MRFESALLLTAAVITSLPRLASVFLVLFLVPFRADAESADLVGLTHRTAELCKAGGDASAAFQELLAAVESEYGANHEAARLVRLYAGSRGCARVPLHPRQTAKGSPKSPTSSTFRSG